MPGPYTILAERLFDGSGAPPRERVALTISPRRVVSIEERGRAWKRPAHPIHDFTGCTIVPGLIDSHCHLALQPELGADASIDFVRTASEVEIVSVMRRNALAAFSSGVTTLRDCGSPGGSGVAFRTEAASTPDGLPRVLVSGRPITTTRGHCHWMGYVADSEDEIRNAVHALADEGVDFLKVMATGGMMTTSSDPYAAQYTTEALSALTTAARSRSKRVAAHALSSSGVRAAIAARVDTIEHCVTTTDAAQDYDSSLNGALAEAGIIVGTTAHWALRGLLRAGDLAAIAERLAPHRELRAAGVTLTVHSDAGTPDTGFDALAESIEIFQIGLQTSISEALQAASSSAATALGIDQETGTLTVGRAADFVVLDGDLDRDIRVLRRVAAVARAGHIRATNARREET